MLLLRDSPGGRRSVLLLLRSSRQLAVMLLLHEALPKWVTVGD